MTYLAASASMINSSKGWGSGKALTYPTGKNRKANKAKKKQRKQAELSRRKNR